MTDTITFPPVKPAPVAASPRTKPYGITDNDFTFLFTVAAASVLLLLTVPVVLVRTGFRIWRAR
jgi:hypothetical protein